MCPKNMLPGASGSLERKCSRTARMNSWRGIAPSPSVSGLVIAHIPPVG